MRKTSNSYGTPRAVRIIAGIALAGVFYYLASISPIQDCATLHVQVHNGGLLTLGRIVLALFAGILIGIPMPIAALAAGILTNPLTGSALASLALVAAVTGGYLSGRLLGRQSPILQSFERWAAGRLWFTDLMAARAQSGLHWASEFVYKSPIPPVVFAGFCGAAIQHLALVELIVGIFLSFISVIVGYAVAGSTVGCAVLDYSHDMPTMGYVLPMILSIILLLIISKLRPRISL